MRGRQELQLNMFRKNFRCCFLPVILFCSLPVTAAGTCKLHFAQDDKSETICYKSEIEMSSTAELSPLYNGMVLVVYMVVEMMVPGPAFICLQ